MKKKAKSSKKVAPTSQKLRGTSKKNVKKSVSVSHKSKEKITPLADRVILRPLSIEEQSTTAAGIIIPDTVSKEKSEQGTVIAVGEGRLEKGVRIPLSVKVGDRVVFSRYGYDEVKLEGVEYYILKEENILAVINN